MTEADKAFCESWCRAHARKWQVLNRAQWKYQFHEKTLVRFVEEVQLRENEITLLLEFLASDDCIATLSLYDQTISSDWKPTRAWLELSNRSQGNVHSVRLYHGLMTELTALGDGPYAVEDGCAYKVTLWYFWNQSSVTTSVTDGGTTVTVPSWTSGISYKITSLSRDRDTGLYTYAVEKRERVQQDVAEYFTAKTVYATHTEEYHLGVKQANVDTTGKQASVSDGKLVRRKISKNADCTSDVHNTTEQEIAVRGASESVHKTLTGTTVTTVNRNMTDKADTTDMKVGESVENTETEGGRWNQTIRTVLKNALDWISGSCRKTIFHHSHHDTIVQSEDPGFTHVDSAVGGRIQEKDVSITSDGAYQVTTKTTQEVSVPKASESVHKSLTGTTKVTVNRNMLNKADTANLGIGESVENTETEGGLWNQTIREVVRNDSQDISKDCAKTIFSHKHGTSKIQGTDPGFTHVEAAEDGKISRKSVSVTSEGSYRVDENVTQELPVSDSTRTVSKTLHGTSVSVESRNQASPLSESGLRVGERVSNSKTEGGLYNTQHVTTGNDPAGVIAESCRHDYYDHVHSELKNESEMIDPETEFTIGKIVSKSGRLNENGTADNTVQESVAVPQINEYQYRRADNSVVHVVKYRNQQVAYLDSHSYLNGYDYLSVNDSVNDYGLHDGQVSWVTNAQFRLEYSDVKFNKSGTPIVFYNVQFNRRLHKWCHCMWRVQMHWICGDAYTDYVNDQMRANPTRTTPGVMWTQLVRGPYSDKDGNQLAEWKWVELSMASGGDGEWTQCDASCKGLHDFIPSERFETFEVLQWLLFSQKNPTEQSAFAVVNALDNLPVAITPETRERVIGKGV